MMNNLNELSKQEFIEHAKKLLNQTQSFISNHNAHHQERINEDDAVINEYNNMNNQNIQQQQYQKKLQQQQQQLRQQQIKQQQYQQQLRQRQRQEHLRQQQRQQMQQKQQQNNQEQHKPQYTFTNDSKENDSRENINEHDLQLFKNTVKQYVEIDNQIRELKKQDKKLNDEIKKRVYKLKERKKLVKEEIKKRNDICVSLNSSIITFMERYSVPNVNLKTGKLTVRKKKKKKFLTKKEMEEKTREYFSNSDDYKAFQDFIKRDINKKVSVLKRTYKKNIPITLD